MYNPIMQFRIAPELKAEVERLAEKANLPVSEVIRACITRALPYVEGRIDEQLARVNDQP